MINRRQILIAISSIALFSCGTKQQELPVLTIPLLQNNTIVLDGNIDDEEWNGSEKITSLISPWVEYEVPETTFYICTDKDYLYFAFDVVDKDMATLFSDKEDDVALGDRVEMFIAGDKELREYYCMEIAPYGNVLDYKASFYRKFNNEWDLPNLLIKTSVSDEGYIVEGRFPISFLPNINEEEEKGKCFYMGIYRGDSPKYGNDSIRWLTWINPNVKEPDFHIFSSFAKVCLE